LETFKKIRNSEQLFSAAGQIYPDRRSNLLAENKKITLREEYLTLSMCV